MYNKTNKCVIKFLHYFLNRLPLFEKESLLIEKQSLLISK